jgi:hypothetical protein
MATQGESWRSMRCYFCKLINTLCFWGPRPELRWKRPWLFAISAVSLTVLTVAVSMSRSESFLVFYVLGPFVIAMSILGIVTSIGGCDACVARLFGEL